MPSEVHRKLAKLGYHVAEATTDSKGFIWIFNPEIEAIDILHGEGYRRVSHKEAHEIAHDFGIEEDLYAAILYCRN